MCEKFKSDDTIKVWPHGTPDECRLIPSQCPQIRPITRSRCRTYGQSPLDFVYEKKFQDYNFRKFSSDERLLQKVRTGKGDETVDSYDDLGNVIYVQFMFGSTQPKVLQQDYIFGDNDIVSAKALRYRMRLEKQDREVFTEDWIVDYMNWIFAQVADFEN